MSRVSISNEAGRDLREILQFSHGRFGLNATRRYRALVRTAYADLAENPERPGVVVGRGRLLLYHLRHSRKPSGVVDPRHFVVFERHVDDIRIVRLFHDAMDLPTRLSDL